MANLWHIAAGEPPPDTVDPIPTHDTFHIAAGLPPTDTVVPPAGQARFQSVTDSVVGGSVRGFRNRFS